VGLKLHQQPAVEAGDPNRLAFRVEFLPNLDPGFAPPEEDLSWGRFQIWAGGRNLCEHVDRGEVRRGVEWYLLPLLEWLTENWDCLLHEQRPPASNAGATGWLSLAETDRPERFDLPTGWNLAAEEVNSTWTARHCLRSCRSGGLFPDVVIRRWMQQVEVSWGESPLAGAPEGFRFLHGVGEARLTPDEVAKPVFSVLGKAVGLLLQGSPRSERLAALGSQIAALEDPARQLTRAAVLAGLGSGVQEWQQRWRRLREALEKKFASQSTLLRSWLEPGGTSGLCVSGSCEAAVMFGSASPTLTDADVLGLAVHLIEASQQKPAARWTMLAKSPQAWREGTSAWGDGYRLAQEWTAAAGVDKGRTGFVDIEWHLKGLGVHVADIELSDAGTAGLAVQPEGGAPHVFVNLRNPKCRFPSGRRFVLAHELCHLLHDRAQGQSLAMISGPWAPRELEQRANAFAAALLMPDNLLRKAAAVSKSEMAFDLLLALAKRLQVSTDALAHHLENMGLIDETTRDGLLAQLVNRSGLDNGNECRAVGRRVKTPKRQDARIGT
jgi:Zn-dependent peptidase ImmA (M78 family)